MAVKGIDLQVNKGETLAIVGESGSGKSQTMMAVMGLLAANGRAEGSAKFQGQEMIGLPLGKLNRIRGARITMIFQEPMTSLDPLYRIGKQLAEPMMRHRGLTAKAARARAIELLKLVRIPDPERRVDSYPYEMSGGQRQRVMIAMALANDPELLIADEPTTTLDVTIQTQILELLAELKARIVRGQTLSLKRREFVEAALAMGLTNWQIIRRHVIPNTIGPVVVFVTVLVPKVILLESFLSFLGLGVQEPMTSWGSLIAEGTTGMQAVPWLLIYPAVFFVVTLFALNFIGDGLRDALDPKDR